MPGPVIDAVLTVGAPFLVATLAALAGGADHPPAARSAAAPARAESPAATAAVTPPVPTREDAARAFRTHRYADAYGRYAELADAGDPLSAAIALAMVCHGPEAFGSAWSATTGQLQRWSVLAGHERLACGLALAEHDRGE